MSVSPFSSQFKYSGAAFEDGSYVLGAPEFVLREDYDNYREQIEQYSSEGYRVLVFGIYDGVIDGKALNRKGYTSRLGIFCLTLLEKKHLKHLSILKIRVWK